MFTKKNIILIVIALVLLGGAFYGGTAYQRGKTPAAGAFSGARGAFAGRAGAAGGSGTSGTIASASATSITVTTANGGSSVVLLSPSTSILKSVTGTLADLTAGANVSIIGTANSDGSITATSVVLRPAGTSFGGVGGRATTTSQ